MTFQEPGGIKSSRFPSLNRHNLEDFSLNSLPRSTYHHNWLPRGPQRTFLALRESQSQNERIMVMAELSAPSWLLRRWNS